MIHIDFMCGRNGKLRWARADTPKGEMRVSGEYSRTVKGKSGLTDGSDGVIYRLLAELANNGYSGQPFEAHDGRIVCLTGRIDKLGIPVKYGGEKKDG